LRRTYGYFSYEPQEKKKLNLEFYHSKNVLICNRYFFVLDIDRISKKIYLVIKDIDYNVIERCAYWDFDDLEEKLNQKLKYLGFVHAFCKKEDGKEYFKYFKLECYTYKNFDVFLDLIEKNIISVSITTSPIKYGPNIGNSKASCYIRINKFDLNKLFDLIYVKNFNLNKHY